MEWFNGGYLRGGAFWNEVVVVEMEWVFKFAKSRKNWTKGEHT
jgi:hypothetical protein